MRPSWIIDNYREKDEAVSAPAEFIVLKDRNGFQMPLMGVGWGK
jgi:hypothetical protein